MHPSFAQEGCVAPSPSGVRTERTCFLVRGLLSPEACAQVVRAAEAQGFLPTGRDYPASYRDNARQVRDDAALAAALFARLRPALPERLTDAEGHTWRLHGLNPRFRLCRYTDGQRFGVHRDGAYHPAPGVRSWLTCMLYLDDARGFAGGHTRYYAHGGPGAEVLGVVRPEAGTAIVFDHALWHDGEAVTAGAKHVLRTDVLYAREGEVAAHGGPGALAGHQGYVWSVLACADGRVATASRDCTVRTWREGPTGWREERVLRGHAASVVALAEDAAGRLWSASRDRRVLCWDTGGRAHEVGLHAGAVLCLARLPDGRMASGGADGCVRLWTPEGAAAGVLDAGGSWVWAVAPLPDGRLAAACEDGVLRVLSGAGAPGAAVALGAALRAACATQEGGLVVGDAGGRVRRLAPSLTPEACVQAHAGAACSVAVAPGRVVSGGEDGAVRVMDAARLAPLAMHGHSDFVRSVAVLPDGRVVSAAYDGLVRVWG